MKENQLSALIEELTGDLQPQSEQEEQELQQLREEVARYGVQEKISTPRTHWFDGQDTVRPQPDTLDQDPMIQQVAQRVIRDRNRIQVDYRIYRRSSPLPDTTAFNATPVWGLGGVITQSRGPFSDFYGRPVWFDYYAIQQMLRIYRGESKQPFLLLPLGSASQKKHLCNQFKLTAGTVYIQAKQFDESLPPEQYIGLRIHGGMADLGDTTTLEDDLIRLPYRSLQSLELQLDIPNHKGAAPENKGIDAHYGSLRLPRSVSFTLQSSGGSLQELTDTAFQVYGASISMDWPLDDIVESHSNTPYYEPLLERFIFPLPISQSVVDGQVVSAASDLIDLEGTITVTRGGWALPLTVVDIDRPTQATGIGGLAIQSEPGLSLSWRGLSESVMVLAQPWLLFEPGHLVLADQGSSSTLATQSLDLWTNAGTTFRSSIELSYAETNAISYHSFSSGIEGINITGADIVAKLNQPVRSDNCPFPIESDNASLLLVTTAASTDFVLVQDLQLVDDPNNINNDQHSLALNNVLLSVTPPVRLICWGMLASENHVSQGLLFLDSGLFNILPILPDPYISNAPIWQREREIQSLLTTLIFWSSSAPDDILQEEEVRLQFLLHPNSFIQPFDPIGERNICAELFRLVGLPVPGRTIPPGNDNSFSTPSRIPYFPDHLRLVDVSTNVDLWGVSYGCREGNEVRVRLHLHPTEQEEHLPYLIEELDLKVAGSKVSSFLLPQHSWEPLLNLNQVDPSNDPSPGILVSRDDGDPTTFFNDSTELVPFYPEPVANFIIKQFEEETDGFTFGRCSLPFGMQSLARFQQNNHFDDSTEGTQLSWNRPQFDEVNQEGAYQLRALAPLNPDLGYRAWPGMTNQSNNLFGNNNVLGGSITSIFHQNFLGGGVSLADAGVPVERINFSGYGSSIFSHWQDRSAESADVSQVNFDVFVGRTAHEVVQVVSKIYPYMIPVVRTVVIFRENSGLVHRFDTGWQSTGEGDFNFSLKDLAVTTSYEVHPGLIRRIYNVENIVSAPASELSSVTGEFTMEPVYFTADIEIDQGESGDPATHYKTASSDRIAGYIHLTSSGQEAKIIDAVTMANILDGPVGGDIDITIDLNHTGQLFRAQRFDVSFFPETGSADGTLVAALRGTPVLPPDGAWSVVKVDFNEVEPLGSNELVSLVRSGLRQQAFGAEFSLINVDETIRFALPEGLVNQSNSKYGFLQTLEAQKVLFSAPAVNNPLSSGLPGSLTFDTSLFADAFSFLDTNAIFPDLEDIRADLGINQLNILPDIGLQLPNPDVVEEVDIEPSKQEITLVDFSGFRIYVRYDRPVFDENVDDHYVTNPGQIVYQLNSAAEDLSERWRNNLTDLTIGIDIHDFKPAFLVTGSLEADRGQEPRFLQPSLEFGPSLQMVRDLLAIIASISAGRYADALEQGLNVAFSNGSDSWDYKMDISQEFPVLRFPPPAVDNAAAAFRITLYLSLGVSFDGFQRKNDALIPSVSAFLECRGDLATMTVSLGVGTVYALGSTRLRLKVSQEGGIGVELGFGFGAQVVVGLPVVGNFFLDYAVGIEIDSTQGLEGVGGFLMYSGAIELAAGLVRVGVSIEAAGTVINSQKSPLNVDIAARITWGMDVSVFLVINLRFERTWEEDRLISQLQDTIPILP